LEGAGEVEDDVKYVDGKVKESERDESCSVEKIHRSRGKRVGRFLN
jgi:hypothetical protein